MFMSILQIAISAVIFCLVAAATEDCPYSSFTWVNDGKSNPYFWKSPSFDWNATATLGIFSAVNSDPERITMRDYAHSIGKTIHAGMGPGDIDMTDPNARSEWIATQIQYVKDQGIDGINLDYEGHKPEATKGYDKLAVELCQAIHNEIPGSEVSVDVPIYPEYEGRNYDYEAIAKSCDSLFVMAYDGEFWLNVQCALQKNVNCSLACAPLQAVEMGIVTYLARNVPASKIYLGLPWYGLKYEKVVGVPIMTGQIQYQDILELIDNASKKGRGSVKLDEASSTYIFDCDGKCSQWSDKVEDRSTTIWYDNPASLAPKYQLASKYSLKGVGMWESTHVYYDPDANSPAADAMWDSLCQRGDN
jgi:spore germination protein YaaH